MWQDPQPTKCPLVYGDVIKSLASKLVRDRWHDQSTGESHTITIRGTIPGFSGPFWLVESLLALLESNGSRSAAIDILL